MQSFSPKNSLKKSIFLKKQKFPYVFSKEEQSAGGRKMTERKRAANALRSLKTGNFSKFSLLQRCSGCELGKQCEFYNPNNACHFQVQTLKKLRGRLATGDIRSLFSECLRVLEKVGMQEALDSNMQNSLDYLKSLLATIKVAYGEKPLGDSADSHVTVTLHDPDSVKDFVHELSVGELKKLLKLKESGCSKEEIDEFLRKNVKKEVSKT